MASIRKCLVVAAGLAGCVSLACGGGGDGGGEPTGGVALDNPAALEAELNAVNATFGTPQVASLQALDALVDLSALSSPGLGQAAVLLRATKPGPIPAVRESNIATALRLREFRSLIPSMRGALATPPVIPDPVLGNTYEWNESNLQYENLGTAGAPSNGVRIILYAINPISLLPASPLNPVGYLDIVDQGNSSASSLGVTLVGSDNVTYIDYDISGTGGSNSFNGSSKGYVTDGTHRLDFDFSIAVTGDQSAGSINFDVAFELNTPHVTGDLSFDLALQGNTLDSDIDFSFQRENETVRLFGQLQATDNRGNLTGTIDFTVQRNGDLLATIRGDENGTQVLDRNGDPLSSEQQAALERLLQAPSQVAVGVTELGDPGLELLNPGNAGGRL